MAVFDVVVNNTDRKGGHVLPMAGRHRYGVDHGVCFHIEDKLRTVLWGWAGDALSAEETAGVEAVLDGLDGDLRESARGPAHRARGGRRRPSLRAAAAHAAASRCPSGGWPSIPWPPF